MGCVDHIKDFATPCPRCGAPICGFQSKDGACNSEDISFRTVDEFHSDCARCHAWLSYKYKYAGDGLPAADRDILQYSWTLTECLPPPKPASVTPPSDHDPRIALTFGVKLSFAIDFCPYHETLNHEQLRERLAALITDRIEVADGVQADDITAIKLIDQEAM